MEGTMRQQFVKTENYRAFVSAVKAVEQRGAAEAGMMLVYGEPGLGKTHTIEHWAAETGALFIRANKGWTPRYALAELATELRVDNRGMSQQLFARVLEPIARNQIPIIIDEAEFTLANRAAALETIRDISDRAENTVILVGMQEIQSDIKKYGQISSRIARVVRFVPATPDDVKGACKQLSEVDMTPELIAEIHRLSGGRMREVLNIIATIEQVAKVGNLPLVDLPHLEGIALIHDWQSLAPTGVTAKKRRAA